MMKFEKITNIVVATLVSVILLINIHAQLSYAQQQCPTLCRGTQIERVSNTQCVDFEEVAELESCCPLELADFENIPDSCKEPVGPELALCRFIEFDNPICSPPPPSFSQRFINYLTTLGAGNCRQQVFSGLLPEECAIEVAGEISFEISFAAEELCENEFCSCFGDPHCTSFEGERDVWIPCDARAVQTNPNSGELICPIERTVCELLVDHTGQACNWNETAGENTRGSHWDIATQGSPCTPSFNPPPEMVMYTATTDIPGLNVNANVSLTLGERGIIQSVIIVDAGNTYILDADNCADFANVPSSQSALLNTPWRAQRDRTSVPPVDDWLPLQFQSAVLSNIDGATKSEIAWQVRNLQSGLQLNILCTYAGQKLRGRPRLSISELIEPFKDERDSVDGFCVTNVIPRFGTEDGRRPNDNEASCLTNFGNWVARNHFYPGNRTDIESQIELNKLYCEDFWDEPFATQCSDDAESLAGDNWLKWACAQHVNDLNRDEDGQLTTILTGRGCMTASCADDESEDCCEKCYKNGIETGDIPVIRRHPFPIIPDDLPPCYTLQGLLDLNRDAENPLLPSVGSIVIEFESEPNLWSPFLTIPSDRKPCEIVNGQPTLRFSSGDLSVEDQNILLRSRLRFRQCGNDPNVPVSSLKINSRFEFGEVSNRDFVNQTKIIEDARKAFDDGIFVCGDGGNDCFDNFENTPPQCDCPPTI